MRHQDHRHRRGHPDAGRNRQGAGRRHPPDEDRPDAGHQDHQGHQDEPSSHPDAGRQGLPDAHRDHLWGERHRGAEEWGDRSPTWDAPWAAAGWGDPSSTSAEHREGGLPDVQREVLPPAVPGAAQRGPKERRPQVLQADAAQRAADQRADAPPTEPWGAGC